VNINNTMLLAGYEPAPLENWYRHHYFNNEFDISGSGVEEYSFQEIQQIAGFSFSELDQYQIGDAQTVGSLKVRTQLANLFGTGDSEMAMATNGANEGLQLVVRALLNAGDEIITLGPCYHCHDKIALSMGCVVQKWALSAEGDLDIKHLKSLISKKTKVLCLNFPHNPTGKSISQAMLDEIVEILRENNIYLIWDAVFQELVYENAPLKDPIHTYSKTVTLGTFSKAYGAPGLRFGWIIAPKEIIARCVRQKDYGNLFVAPLIEFVAEKMLAKLDAFSVPRLLQAKNNREAVQEWIGKTDLDVNWYQPDGGVCGLLKLPSKVNDFDFCTSLLESTGVLLVPGSCFGLTGFARLGFGGNSHKLIKGLDRLEHFLGD